MTSFTGVRLVESRPVGYLEFKNQVLTRNIILGREFAKEQLLLAGDKVDSTCVITITDRVNQVYATAFDIKNDGAFLLYLKPPSESLDTFSIKVEICQPLAAALPPKLLF